MLGQYKLYCQEKKKAVEVLSESEDKTPMTCNEMLFCEGTTFCRYVNPLTTRNPLVKLEEAEVGTA